MAKRKRGRPKRRKTTRKRTTTKSKIAGYTRTKGKYAIVFKKGKKLSVGKSRFSSKNSLMKSARKYL